MVEATAGLPASVPEAANLHVEMHGMLKGPDTPKP